MSEVELGWEPALVLTDRPLYDLGLTISGIIGRRQAERRDKDEVTGTR